MTASESEIQARLLVQALPFMQRYENKTIVVKYGGHAMGDAAQWLKGEEMCVVTLFNGAPLAIAPPNFVELKIVETDPGVRGDTATGGQKPAKLETGAVVRVPLFIR